MCMCTCLLPAPPTSFYCEPPDVILLVITGDFSSCLLYHASGLNRRLGTRTATGQRPPCCNTTGYAFRSSAMMIAGWWWAWHSSRDNNSRRGLESRAWWQAIIIPCLLPCVSRIKNIKPLSLLAASSCQQTCLLSRCTSLLLLAILRYVNTTIERTTTLTINRFSAQCMPKYLYNSLQDCSGISLFEESATELMYSGVINWEVENSLNEFTKDMVCYDTCKCPFELDLFMEACLVFHCAYCRDGSSHTWQLSSYLQRHWGKPERAPHWSNGFPRDLWSMIYVWSIVRHSVSAPAF